MVNTLITIKVKLDSLKNSIEYFGSDRYLVKVQASNHNEANKLMIDMLSKYTGISPNRFEFIRGLDSEDKLVRII
jgi:uncharacterized protein YggU (UPF0235/DUF167 family)